MVISLLDRPRVENPTAKRVLMEAGVPELTLKRAERHGHVDWKPLASAMDDMFLSGHGRVTQIAFLRSKAGKNLSTLQLLERPGGSVEVQRAAARWLRQRT